MAAESSSHTPAWSLRLQREWLSGGPWSLALLPLAWLYGLLSAARRLLYRLDLLRTERLAVPVLVVGNWIVGGAGKTPTTLALLQQMQAWGIKAGVISRGHGRAGDALRLVRADSAAAEVGDEPLLIHLRSAGRVPVAVGRDRVAAARALLQAHPDVQLLISDDGLQHLRLPRDLVVLVFDARGVGNGRLLPAGPLRQPFRARAAAREMVLYNADRPSTALPGHLARRRLAGAVGLRDWWAGQAASLEALHALRDGPVWAAAGMAQPQRFFDMLAAEGLQIEQALALPDHHDFAALPWPDQGPDVLVTEKDAVKLRPERCVGRRVWVVALDFRPEHAFMRELRAHLDTLGCAAGPPPG